MKKRGQAAILSVILIILIVLVAIIILWNVVQVFLQKSADEVSITTFKLKGDLEYWLERVAMVKVHRGAGKGNITGVKIIFISNVGQSWSFTTSDFPEELETKVYIVIIDDLIPTTPILDSFDNIVEITLHYIYENKRVSNEMDNEIINQERISPKLNERWYVDNDGDRYGVIGGTVYNSEDECKTANSQCDSSIQNCCTPSGGDCNDIDRGINPGAKEICDDGIDNNCDGNENEGCGGDVLKNYDVTPVTMGTLWSDCSDNLQIDDFDLTLPWTLKFYIDEITDVRVCKNGYILIGGGSCANTATNIENIKVIAPYYFNNIGLPPPSKEIYYCDRLNDIIIKWVDQNNFEAQTIINKDSSIKFSYNGVEIPLTAEVGISYGDGTYHNRLKIEGTSFINSDYTLKP